MYTLYSVVIVAFFALMSPSLLYQAVRYRKYIGSLSQRLGYLPISFNLDADESIWIHAVSVGEVLIRPLAEALSAEERTRPRERLTAILIAFGSIGRREVEQLKSSPNAAVRRTAVYLLRNFGGSESQVLRPITTGQPMVWRLKCAMSSGRCQGRALSLPITPLAARA